MTLARILNDFHRKNTKKLNSWSFSHKILTKCLGGKPTLCMWGFRCRQNHSSMLLSDFVTLFCKISCFESIIFSSKLPSAKFSFRFLFFDLLKISIKIFNKKNYNNLIDNFNNFFTIISLLEIVIMNLSPLWWCGMAQGRRTAVNLAIHIFLPSKEWKYCIFEQND